MTSDGADRIIAQVEEQVAEAIKKLDFRSGDRETTRVISGFPFTIIKEADGRTAFNSDTESVAPWFPEYHGMYSEAGNGGSNVFVLPFDPTTLVNGVPCYDTPRPYLFIPKDQYRLVYLQQSFEVEAWEDEIYGPVIESITAGPATIFTVEDDDIPYSSYPGPNEDFLYPGEYTYFFLLARFYGVEDAPALNMNLFSSSGSGNAEIVAEDAARNYGARKMITISPGPFNANFPFFVTFGGNGASAGDVAAEGGYLATSYPAP